MQDIKDFIIPGKVNILFDGQFGSTGKGLVAGWIGENCHVDIAIAITSPNAGHTYYTRDDQKIVVKHIPISGILNDRSMIYFSADSVIDPKVLFKEIQEYEIDPARIFIHPRASIVDDITREKDKECIGIASTMTGTGAARASKVMRKAILAKDHPIIKLYTNDAFTIHPWVGDSNTHVFVESSQGFDLSLNHGYSYPYCTSKDITPTSIMAELGMPCKYLGNTIACIRSYPIRVGNIVDEMSGEILGYSGPFYPDSNETSFEELCVPTEYTTVTKRPRRIATFSLEQYKRMIMFCEPTYVFLNFLNYAVDDRTRTILDMAHKFRKFDYVSTGHSSLCISKYEDGMINMVKN